jgi:hypothetical protein
MTVPDPSATVNDAFFRPLSGLADAAWVEMGVLRSLEIFTSGRAFLQKHRFLGRQDTPSTSAYFHSLSSRRRLDILGEVETKVRGGARIGHDRLAHIPELDKYQVFALDGHWHKAAAHDPRHNGMKMAVGHFYSLDLRTHLLRHLATAEGLHEHDMSALERVTPRGLKQDAPKGVRTLLIYDKAGVDLPFWKRCRHECGTFFLSRIKENMVYDVLEDLPIDREDARNRGVTGSRKIVLNGGHVMHLVTYTAPQDGKAYQFLTNAPDLPPGVIAELYRRRWEIEKVFDEIKNKLGEDKAWAGRLEARTAQALFITLTHNLMVIYEDLLEREQGVINKAEDARRTQRVASLESRAEDRGLEVSSLLLAVRKATQRPVKFVRWLAASIAQNLAEAAAVPRLIASYQRL